MTSIRFALLLIGILEISLLHGSGHAAAEAASCEAQLKAQDARCQELAEKLAEACPGGAHIKETARCRELSNQIANTCTRKPCAPARKSSRGRGMSRGMSKPRRK